MREQGGKLGALAQIERSGSGVTLSVSDMLSVSDIERQREVERERYGGTHVNGGR